jgi:hypothetical protein
MALQLRPNCEYCDKDLPADTLTARICSYECTFCADCAENILQNVCPNWWRLRAETNPTSDRMAPRPVTCKASTLSYQNPLVIQS